MRERQHLTFQFTLSLCCRLQTFLLTTHVIPRSRFRPSGNACTRTWDLSSSLVSPQQTYIFLAAGEAEDEAETDGERDGEGTKLFLK